MSVPLSSKALLAQADRLGNPKLGASPEWHEVEVMARPGDQFRHVNCLGTTRGPGAGEFFYALFRGGKVVTKFGYMLFN